jgi:hypothetical protein
MRSSWRYAKRLLVGAPLSVMMIAGCTSIGPTRLTRDHLDYTRMLSESSKRQTLFNLVRMRFGQPPAFVSINQLVAGYQVQGSAQAGVESFPSASASSFWNLSGGVQITDRPTFTLSPVTGEQFVQSYLRPFAPAEILPLIQGGMPVDKLFRLTVQSIGPLQNIQPLAGAHRGGSPEFLPTLQLLRTLQDGGALRVRVRREGNEARAFLLVDIRQVPQLRNQVEAMCSRLSVNPNADEVEIVYGTVALRAQGREIPILTRSLLGIMAAIAAEVEVSESDVREGRTLATLRAPGAPTPIVVVSSGHEEPGDAYAAVRVADRWYWIADQDFESKITFSVLELLKSIGESGRISSAPVLTIPTN